MRRSASLSVKTLKPTRHPRFKSLDEGRREITEKRNQLDEIFIRRESEKIQQVVIQTEEFRKARCVAIYWAKYGEVQTELIFKECLKLGKKVAIPKASGDRLEFREVEDVRELERGSFGIMEPQDGKPKVCIDEIDLFIVPGIMFDSRGFRVGFGKGYFDKALAGTSASKFALAWEFQVFDYLPFEKEGDVFVDAVFTEEGVLTRR